MRKFFGILTIVAVTFLSCKKDNKYIAAYNGVGGTAFLRVMHVSPNFRAVQNKPDSFDVYVGTQKINGPLFTYNVVFPTATTNNNTYAAVPAGTQPIRFSLRGVNKTDSLTILEWSKNLTAGQYYTFFITDSMATNQVFLNDNFTTPEVGKYRLRLAHMMLNDTPGRLINVYSYRAAANVFTNIAPGTVTDFLTFNVATVSDTFSIRRPGTNQELFRLNTVTFTNNQRVYTMVYKGSPGVTGTNVRARNAVVMNNR